MVEVVVGVRDELDGLAKGRGMGNIGEHEVGCQEVMEDPEVAKGVKVLVIW